ncbi:MAG: twin-arginine translocase TatA/TatE family subunit [Cyclonatronaceae bacterium]
MGALGGFEWMIIIVVLLLLFGARKIPGLARSIGQGIFEFRKAVKDDKQDKPDDEKGKKGEKDPG